MALILMDNAEFSGALSIRWSKLLCGGFMNSITEIAKKHGRDYITPEDVNEALSKLRFASLDRIAFVTQRVRMDVLEILARQTDFGVEDSNLCAFIAWRGNST